MQDDPQQKKNKSNIDNNKLVSSLKYYDFEGMTKEEIIIKFDSLLEKREKLINELNNDNCILNEKLNISNSYNSQIENEKKELMIKCNKLEMLFKQELVDKEILLTKNSKLERENIHLLKNIDLNNKSTSNTSNNKGGISGFFQDISDKFSNKNNTSNTSENTTSINNSKYKDKDDTNKKFEDTQKEKIIIKNFDFPNEATKNSQDLINSSIKTFKISDSKKEDQEFGMLGSDNIDYEPLFD